MNKFETAILSILATLFVCALSLAIVAGIIVGPPHRHPARDFTPAATGSVRGVPIEEDDPRWNCATMGNHQCGQGAVPLSLYCQTETTDNGTEIIGYDAGTVVTSPGLAVTCPS